MKQKFIVDRIADGCIRVYPENQETAAKPAEVKKHKVTMYDYGEKNGFSLTPKHVGEPQPGTVFKIKDMPLATLHESKNKFFIRLSFTKATLQDAQRIIQRDEQSWFDFFNEYLTQHSQQTL